MELWTATVDSPDSKGIVTTVHFTEDDALESLKENYDPEDEAANITSGNTLEYLTEHAGYVIYVEPHQFPGVSVMLKGDPVDGFTITGPYETSELAVQAGDTVTSDWWVVDLLDPEEG